MTVPHPKTESFCKVQNGPAWVRAAPAFPEGSSLTLGPSLVKRKAFIPLKANPRVSGVKQDGGNPAKEIRKADRNIAEIRRALRVQVIP